MRSRWNRRVGLLTLICSLFQMPMALSQDSKDQTLGARAVDRTSNTKMEDAGVKGHKNVVVCYVGTWATYRLGDGAFDLFTHFDPNLCTHLIYAFAGLDNDTSTIKVMDPYLDLEQDYGKGWYSKATALRTKYPHLKVLLAIGGWNEGSVKYSNMVANSTARMRFVTSAVDLIRKHNFDGLDFDWEFPADRGGNSGDKRLFTVLMQDLRSEFNRYGLLLTAAVSASTKIAAAAYDLPELSKVLDHFHLMCYDFHGSWDQKTNHNAPIHGTSHNIAASVDFFLQGGVPASKLVLGVPFYGRTFLLNNSTTLKTGGLGDATAATGFQGPLTKEDGFLGYNEICLDLTSNPGQWEAFWDDQGQVPWIRQGSKWVSFDNPLSIKHKADFVLRKGLKGLMVWSVDTDDFRGTCGPKYPLLKAINHALATSQTASDGTGGSVLVAPDAPVTIATTLVALSSVAIRMLRN